MIVRLFALCALASWVSCVDDGPELATAEQAVVTQDVMMFHFDELPPAGAFDDKSSIDANGSCANGSICPGVGGTGLRGTPLNNNVRRAADFNGFSDCVTVPDRPEHSFNLSNGLSFSVWILPKGPFPTAGNGEAIVSKYSTLNDQREWILGIRNINGGPRLAFWKSSQGNSATTIAVYSSRVLQSSDLGQWMHVVLRISAGGSYTWFINGVADTSGTITDKVFKAGTATTRIGCVERSTTAPDMYFTGKIDELLVAKSYISSADILLQYNWSRPQQPTMAYVAGVDKGDAGLPGSLLQANGRVDVPALAARIRDLHPDVYRFIMRPNGACAERCQDYLALDELLKTFVEHGDKTRVIVEIDPLWHYVGPDGAPASCTAQPTNEEMWGCAIGALAAQYPYQLVAWSIDDFFSDHAGYPDAAFLDRFHAVNACRALKEQAPDLPVYATLYCDAPIATAGHDLSWLNGPSAAGGQDDMLYDFFIHSGEDGVDPAELRACITGVNVYFNQDYWDGVTPKQDVINGCLDGLRRLQTDGSFTINEGVYITSTTGHPMTCTERRSNVDAARLTIPDGFIFYEMLSPLEPPELPCSQADYDYAGLKAATQSPSAFVRW